MVPDELSEQDDRGEQADDIWDQDRPQAFADAVGDAHGVDAQRQEDQQPVDPHFLTQVGFHDLGRKTDGRHDGAQDQHGLSELVFLAGTPVHKRVHLRPPGRCEKTR